MILPDGTSKEGYFECNVYQGPVNLNEKKTPDTKSRFSKIFPPISQTSNKS